MVTGKLVLTVSGMSHRLVGCNCCYPSAPLLEGRIAQFDVNQTFSVTMLTTLQSAFEIFNKKRSTETEEFPDKIFTATLDSEISATFFHLWNVNWRRWPLGGGGG